MSAMSSAGHPQASVVDEGGFFTVLTSDTETQIIEKLQRLGDERFPTEIDFIIYGISWTQDIASAMIQCFEKYTDANLHWNEGTFSDVAEQNESFCSVLHSAAKLKLFRTLTFNNQIIVERPMELKFAITLAEIFWEGNYAEHTNISNFEISANAMASLARGLKSTSQSQETAHQELTFTYNRFLDQAVDGETKGASEYLADGLAMNKTLTALSLYTAHINDRSLSAVLDSLIGHPSLKCLRMNECEYGSSSIQSIRRLLGSDRCKLEELHIDEHYIHSEESEYNMDMGSLVRELPTNNSLKSLSLSDHGDIDNTDVNLLLQNLVKLPNLRSLDLSDNGIEDIVALTADLDPTAPIPHLRSLNLDNNQCMEQLVEALLGATDSIPTSFFRLLDAFPEVGYFGEDVAIALESIDTSTRFEHQLYQNRCLGRVFRGGKVPISVWPKIIAKLNGDRCVVPKLRWRATILYEIVQGPAFVGRDSL